MSRIVMLIEQGGPMLWVIVVAGLIALGVFIERALSYWFWNFLGGILLLKEGIKFGLDS